MTDYTEARQEEIECLQSIYPSEFQVVSEDPYAFTVFIKSETVSSDHDQEMSVVLRFTLGDNYPDIAPQIEVDEADNLEDQDQSELLQRLRQEAEENLGNVMVFNLVSTAIEWLGQHAEVVSVRKREQETAKQLALEEEDKKKFEGTRVTIETFMAWKAKFDHDMKMNSKNKKKEEGGSKKLTGKEMFLKDKNLADSELQFLQEGEDDVQVDESLFEELDDLDLEDEDRSDED